jgi:hypothetical protein
MSAIVMLLLFVCFWKPPRAGEVLSIFLLTDLCFFAEVLLAVVGLPAPRCVATAPTRHSPLA